MAAGLTIREIPFVQNRVVEIAGALNGGTRSQVAETFRQVLGMEQIAFYLKHYNNPLENRMMDISGGFGVTSIAVSFVGLGACLCVSVICYSATWQLGCTITGIATASLAGGSLLGLAVNEIRRRIYWSRPEEDIQSRLTALMEKALATSHNPNLYNDPRINFCAFEGAINSYYGRERQ